ncbi:MAG: replication initiator protein A [Eubacterium sp.]|nr:replication initiator protein A [Eubacterium sp.]
MRDYEYFSLSESDNFSFYRIPKRFIQDPAYDDMSFDAKFLYGILLDRLELSRKNDWVDEKGHVFLIFPVREVMETVRCGEKKAMRLLAELEEAHLIERVRRRMGKPDLIYLKNFTRIRSPTSAFRGGTEKAVKELPETPFRNCQKGSYETSRKAVPERPKSGTNNTDIKETDKSETDINPVSSAQDGSDGMDERNAYRSFFLKETGFSFLEEEEPYQRELLEEILDLLVDVCSTGKQTIVVAGDEKPSAVVRSQLMKLGPDHIRYVLSSLEENPTRITNVRQYLLATLYNATMTMNHYYQARYNSDKAGGK